MEGCMKKALFEYRAEEGQNPYIGFMSFQHYRGEKLYSDIVVKPENKMTETERVECYPISPDAEENGRNEGWYPDNTVAYFRVLWKEFEPRQGEYRYSFIEEILEGARRHGQTVIFRLIAHSTRESDDLPDWLRALIPCPERPPMKRVKESPTHPLFMELFLRAVQAFGERFDADPTLDAVDISLPGAWGEGHRLQDYPEGLFREIVDVYARAFPTTQLMTQLARHELIEYAEKYTHLGWRGDGLGSPDHTTIHYPPHIACMPDQWKVAPVSFESFWWLCEWQRRGWDIDAVIEKTLEWHISSFNPKSIPIPYDWREKCEAWIRRMGYHFTPRTFTYPEKILRGTELSTELAIENVGCAPCYKPLPLVLRLVGEGVCLEFTQACDIRTWLPGIHRAELKAMIPTEIPKGTYAVQIGILSPHAPVVYLATDAPRDNGFYTLAKLTVE